MKVIEVEGKSVDDAVKKAAKQLNIAPSQISSDSIEVLDEGKTGIFGFGVSRPAKVRVSFNVQTVDVGDITREILMSILTKMGVSAEIKDLHEGESKVYIELQSENSGLVIGKKGKTLESLQFILNLIVNNKTRTDKKIILDIETYRAKREKSLKRLSKEIAQKVYRTGKSWTLEPMNPFERRLIHLTLQDDNRVFTKSEGQGIYRKVKISPRSKY